jgi:Family of unknown function (DUF6893)
VTFGALVIAGAALAAVLVREIPGIVRYVKLSRM